MSTEVQTAAANTAMEVTIHTQAGDVKLNPAIVRKYLVNGNGAVNDQEIALFLGLCKAQSLNPFTREAYLIKYSGNQPAAIVVAKDVFLKRAYRSEHFRGHKAGIICQAEQGGELLYTPGVCPPGAKIVGGWAEVHTDGWAFPLRVEVDFKEYQARKSDGTPNRMWTEKPATMIRKVALVQALREAFPDNYQGMYSEEEIGTPEELPRNPVDTSSVIDVGDQKENATELQMQQAPTKSGATEAPTPEYRRRRHKFRVDPVIFGSDEILTCGCTDEQLRQLHALAKLAPGAKEWISARAKESTGYDQWSFMREEEASELLRLANERFAVHEQAEAPTPQPSSTDTQVPDDLVDCPRGDRVSVSTYCKEICKERKAQGWCPVIDDPPEMSAEGGML